MLARLVLIILQAMIAWNVAPWISSWINLGARQEALGPFILAALFAILVYLTGLIGAEVLKDTPRPSGATLAACVVLALAGAAIVVFVPAFPSYLPVRVRPVVQYLPLILAIVGYFVKR